MPIQRERLIHGARQQALVDELANTGSSDTLDDEGVQTVERTKMTECQLAPYWGIGIDVGKMRKTGRERRQAVHGDGVAWLRSSLAQDTDQRQSDRTRQCGNPMQGVRRDACRRFQRCHFSFATSDSAFQIGVALSAQRATTNRRPHGSGLFWASTGATCACRCVKVTRIGTTLCSMPACMNAATGLPQSPSYCRGDKGPNRHGAMGLAAGSEQGPRELLSTRGGAGDGSQGKVGTG